MKSPMHPAPPEAITGTFTARHTASSMGMSKPPRTPSVLMEFRTMRFCVQCSLFCSGTYNAFAGNTANNICVRFVKQDQGKTPLCRRRGREVLHLSGPFQGLCDTLRIKRAGALNVVYFGLMWRDSAPGPLPDGSKRGGHP